MKQLELDLRSTQERSRTWYDIVVDDRLRQREDVAFEEREFERSQTRAFWRRRSPPRHTLKLGLQ